MDWLKEKFAWTYKRFLWGYGFAGSGVAMFNFVGILTLLIRGNEISRYILIPVLMIVGSAICIITGFVMFDWLKFKTKFTRHEGTRDEYWTSRLSPVQQKMMLVYLEAIGNPKKIAELKKKVEGGVL